MDGPLNPTYTASISFTIVSQRQSWRALLPAYARGEIWATTQQLNYLLDSVCQVPSLRVVSANGDKLLTCREEQVVV